MDLAHVSFSGVDVPRRPRRIASGTPPHPRRAIAETERVLHPFAGWVLRQAGVDLAGYRTEPMQRRMAACLRALRVGTPDAARELLERRPELLVHALDAMLIGVSSFFRDPEVFAALRETALPQLLQTRTGIRVYSAGVSSGQELYSIAMLLDGVGALSGSELLGLDCRPQAISDATIGGYSETELAGLSDAERERYFPRTSAGRLAAASLRSRIQWRCGNVITYRDPQPFQLILFRNVAIYLRTHSAEQAWHSLDAQLERGGFLITGRAEQPPRFLRLARVGPSVYRKL